MTGRFYIAAILLVEILAVQRVRADEPQVPGLSTIPWSGAYLVIQEREQRLVVAYSHRLDELRLRGELSGPLNSDSRQATLASAGRLASPFSVTLFAGWDNTGVVDSHFAAIRSDVRHAERWCRVLGVDPCNTEDLLEVLEGDLGTQLEQTRRTIARMRGHAQAVQRCSLQGRRAGPRAPMVSPQLRTLCQIDATMACNADPPPTGETPAQRTTRIRLCRDRQVQACLVADAEAECRVQATRSCGAVAAPPGETSARRSTRITACSDSRVRSCLAAGADAGCRATATRTCGAVVAPVGETSAQQTLRLDTCRAREVQTCLDGDGAACRTNATATCDAQPAPAGETGPQRTVRLDECRNREIRQCLVPAPRGAACTDTWSDATRTSLVDLLVGPNSAPQAGRLQQMCTLVGVVAGIGTPACTADDLNTGTGPSRILAAIEAHDAAVDEVERVAETHRRDESALHHRLVPRQSGTYAMIGGEVDFSFSRISAVPIADISASADDVNQFRANVGLVANLYPEPWLYVGVRAGFAVERSAKFLTAERCRALVSSMAEVTGESCADIQVRRTEPSTQAFGYAAATLGLLGRGVLGDANPGLELRVAFDQLGREQAAVFRWRAFGFLSPAIADQVTRYGVGLELTHSLYERVATDDEDAVELGDTVGFTVFGTVGLSF